MKPTIIKVAVTVTFEAMLVLAMTVPASYAAVPGSGTATCETVYPITRVATEGSGRNVPKNLTMTVTFTGPITNANKLARGGKQNIKVCEGAQLDYRVETTAGTANCTLDKRPIQSQGTIKVHEGSQRLSCTNKPDGIDTDQFQIISVNH
jgi:hypothetical protein